MCLVISVGYGISDVRIVIVFLKKSKKLLLPRFSLYSLAKERFRFPNKFGMHLLFVVAFNALILWIIKEFLPGVSASDTWQFYFAGGVVLGLLNGFVRPILKLFGFPFLIITFGGFILVINAIILALFEKILSLLHIAGTMNPPFEFGGIGNFAIAVVIFTLFNTISGVFFKK